MQPGLMPQRSHWMASLGLVGEPRGSSGKRLALVEMKVVGEIIPDLVPLEIDTAANAEGIGGRDHPKSFRSPSFLPSD